MQRKQQGRAETRVKVLNQFVQAQAIVVEMTGHSSCSTPVAACTSLAM